MRLTAQQRREFLAASHHLKAAVVVSADKVTETVIAHVRAAFGTGSLVKVRVNAADRATCDQVAKALATGVPCEVVRRIGRVLLLYRWPDGIAS